MTLHPPAFRHVLSNHQVLGWVLVAFVFRVERKMHTVGSVSSTYAASFLFTALPRWSP